MNFFKNKNNFLYLNIILTLCGFLFLVYYIFRASENVVSSDYIRLGYYYLHDVHDLKYLFSIECISRVPFTFLARIINVDIFKYNVFFDRILGIIGISILNFSILKYLDEFIKNDKIRFFAYFVFSYVIFSLNDWEMILNGTGYPHFIALALMIISINYFEKDDKTTYILLTIASLIFGGQYSVSFLMTLIFVNILYLIINCFKKNKKISKNINFIYTKDNKKSLIYIFISLICLSLFLISNNSGEPLTVVGMKNTTIFEILKEDFLFPIKFLVKALAGSLIGVETFTYAIAFNTITEKMIYLVGFLYLLIIIYVLYIIIRFIMNKKFYTVPFILFIMGLANYALVFLARYKFVKTDYGMSSTYQLQFLILLLSIMLYLFKYFDEIDFKNKSNVLKVLLASISLFTIVYGRTLTNLDEIFKADYRKIIYNELVSVARNYRDYDKEELMNRFEYHRDYEHIVYTLETLKEQHLNVFSD